MEQEIKDKIENYLRDKPCNHEYGTGWRCIHCENGTPLEGQKINKPKNISAKEAAEFGYHLRDEEVEGLNNRIEGLNDACAQQDELILSLKSRVGELERENYRFKNPIGFPNQ